MSQNIFLRPVSIDYFRKFNSTIEIFNKFIYNFFFYYFLFK